MVRSRRGRHAEDPGDTGRTRLKHWSTNVLYEDGKYHFSFFSGVFLVVVFFPGSRPLCRLPRKGEDGPVPLLRGPVTSGRVGSTTESVKSPCRLQWHTEDGLGGGESVGSSWTASRHTQPPPEGERLGTDGTDFGEVLSARRPGRKRGGRRDSSSPWGPVGKRGKRYQDPVDFRDSDGVVEVPSTVFLLSGLSSLVPGLPRPRNRSGVSPASSSTPVASWTRTTRR